MKRTHWLRFAFLLSLGLGLTSLSSCHVVLGPFGHRHRHCNAYDYGYHHHVVVRPVRRCR